MGISLDQFKKEKEKELDKPYFTQEVECEYGVGCKHYIPDIEKIKSFLLTAIQEAYILGQEDMVREFARKTVEIFKKKE